MSSYNFLMCITRICPNEKLPQTYNTQPMLMCSPYALVSWLDFDWQSEILQGFKRIPIYFRMYPWVLKNTEAKMKVKITIFSTCSWLFKTMRYEIFLPMNLIFWRLQVWSQYMWLYSFPNPNQGHMFVMYKWTMMTTVLNTWGRNCEILLKFIALHWWNCDLDIGRSPSNSAKTFVLCIDYKC